LLNEYSNMKIDPISWEIGSILLKSMLLEVSSHPKPGLVTSKSNGSHQDMSILTFMVGSAEIAPALFQFAQAGRNHQGELKQLLQTIRMIGIPIENNLLKGTKGVNTQRGILFSAGIVCGAAGYLSKKSEKIQSEEVFHMVSEITKGIVDRELVNMDKTKKQFTAGEHLYKKYEAKGIRGEVEAGFPSVKEVGLPAFYDAIKNGADLNSSLVHTLISLMTTVEDTTILWRKNRDTLIQVQQQAQEILELGSVFTTEGLEAIQRLDQEFIKENISPGGSADLLSITMAIYLLENEQFPMRIL